MRLFRERKLSLDDAYARERQQIALARYISHPAIQNTGVTLQGEWPEPIPAQKGEPQQPETPAVDLVPIIKIDSRF